ncbi:MAG: hypothetical protein U0871_09435 [Gemmataceae bacterium]
MLVPGLALAGVAATVAAVALAAVVVGQLRPVPGDRTAAGPAGREQPAGPADRPGAIAAAPNPAPPVAEPPVLTPEPADAHPGLTRPDPLDQQYPLARDPARAAALTAERRAWYAGQLDADAARAHRAFAAVVKAATDAQVEVLAHPHGRPAERWDRQRAAVAAAVAAGCEDPAVVFAHKRAAGTGPDAAFLSRAAAGVISGQYSPLGRLHAGYGEAADAYALMPTKPVDAQLRHFWAAVADLCRLRHRAADEEVLGFCLKALASGMFGPDAHARFRAVDAGLAAAGAGDWLRGVVDGVHQVKWAWEARGGGAAGTVTEQGWRLFRDRLAAAEARLAAAHALAPDRPQAAAEMVAVCMGQGRDRAAMEGWFAKAVAADPDDPWAYRQKLTYLMPKWHGSEAELLAFARQCLRASTGDDRHNEYLYLAYRELAARARQADAPDVWSRPGVWADLRAAYEPRLAAHPGDRLARTQLFRACVLCGQPQAADRHRRRLAAGGWWEADLPPAERRELEQRLDAALGRQAPGR